MTNSTDFASIKKRKRKRATPKGCDGRPELNGDKRPTYVVGDDGAVKRVDRQTGEKLADGTTVLRYEGENPNPQQLTLRQRMGFEPLPEGWSFSVVNEEFNGLSTGQIAHRLGLEMSNPNTDSTTKANRKSWNEQWIIAAVEDPTLRSRDLMLLTYALDPDTSALDPERLAEARNLLSETSSFGLGSELIELADAIERDRAWRDKERLEKFLKALSATADAADFDDTKRRAVCRATLLGLSADEAIAHAEALTLIEQIRETASQTPVPNHHASEFADALLRFAVHNCYGTSKVDIEGTFLQIAHEDMVSSSLLERLGLVEDSTFDAEEKKRRKNGWGRERLEPLVSVNPFKDDALKLIIERHSSTGLSNALAERDPVAESLMELPAHLRSTLAAVWYHDNGRPDSRLVPLIQELSRYETWQARETIIQNLALLDFSDATEADIYAMRAHLTNQAVSHRGTSCRDYLLREELVRPSHNRKARYSPNTYSLSEESAAESLIESFVNPTAAAHAIIAADDLAKNKALWDEAPVSRSTFHANAAGIIKGVVKDPKLRSVDPDTIAFAAARVLEQAEQKIPAVVLARDGLSGEALPIVAEEVKRLALAMHEGRTNLAAASDSEELSMGQYSFASKSIPDVPSYGVEWDRADQKRSPIGNLDPRYTGKSSAIEAALDAPLPPAGVALVTPRPDLDAYGAMAVLSLRASGSVVSPEVEQRVQQIADLQRAAEQQAKWEPHTFEVKPPSSAELVGLSVAIQDYSAEEAVPMLRSWLSTGEMPDAAYDGLQKHVDGRNMMATRYADQRAEGTAVAHTGPVAWVAASNVTPEVVFQDAPVAVLSKEHSVEKKRFGRSEVSYKHTVAVHPGFEWGVPEQLVQALNAREVELGGEGRWGANKTNKLLGSPQDTGSRIPPAEFHAICEQFIK